MNALAFTVTIDAESPAAGFRTLGSGRSVINGGGALVHPAKTSKLIAFLTQRHAEFCIALVR